MALLIADIIDDRREIRRAYAKGAVSFLPCELSLHLTDPLGGICLDEENGLCQSKRGRKLDQTMDVIFGPANCMDKNSFFPADTSDVCTHTRLDFPGNHPVAF